MAASTLPDGSIKGYGYRSLVDENHRDALASYFTQALNFKIDPTHLVTAAAATAVVEHVVFALLEPGDGLIIPSPLYPGFLVDLGARSQIEMIHAQRSQLNKKV